MGQVIKFILVLFLSINAFGSYSDSADITSQGAIINNANPIGVRLSDGTNYLSGLPVTQSGAWSVTLNAGSAAIGSINNTVFGSTQSGVWNVGLTGGTNGLALEAGHLASMDATLALIKTKTDNIDVALSTRTKPADTQNISGSVSISGTPNVNVSNASIAVTAASLPLPTNAATSALQTTGNTSLSTIAANTPALGQAVASASSPVVLPAAQITALTPPTTVTVTQPTGTNLHAVIDSGTVTTTISGTPNVNVTNSSIPVTGAVTANIGTTNGLALESGHAASTDTSTAAINSKITTTANGIKVDGTGATQPVSIVGTPSFSVSNLPATQAISAVSLPLPTGAAADSSLTTLNTSVNTLLKPASTLAAVTNVGSVTSITNPVSISGTVPVSGSVSITGTPTVTANIGTTNGLALESGHAASTDVSTAAINTKVSTAANQATEISSLSSIVTNTAATVTALNAALPAGTNSIGQVTTNAGTNTSTAALALETTQLAMSAKLDNATQKTQIVNAAGTTLASQSDGNGGQALEVSLTSTVFVFSAANSTTAQLASLATFTGTIETTTNQPSISINVVSDQNGILTINQYVTSAAGTKVTPIVFNITANAGFSRSFPINGNFINVVFQNTGASATTNLNINTAYGIIPSASSLGNTPVSLDEVNGTALSLGQKTAALSIPVTLPTKKLTYKAAFQGAVTAATATDIFTITGSATKTVKILKILVSGIQTTSSAAIFNIIKRSTANSAGTSTTPSVIPVDSSFAAGTAVVRAYTVNPTLGTQVGTTPFATVRKEIPTAAFANSDYNPYVFDFASESGELAVLRGVNEVLSLNLASASISGNNMSLEIIWTEE